MHNPERNLEDNCLLTRWQPVLRGRELSSGFCKELGKLCADAKRETERREPRKGESIDAARSGGSVRSSDEAS